MSIDPHHPAGTRQSSAATEDNEGATPDASYMSHIQRMRKDNEQLFASEEGKKLSSKERRRLKTKVNAVAFRLRRMGKNHHHASNQHLLTLNRIYLST
jgi:hypothetical protein